MDTSEFLWYLVSRGATRQLGLQLAWVHENATQRRRVDVIGTP